MLTKLLNLLILTSLSSLALSGCGGTSTSGGGGGGGGGNNPTTITVNFTGTPGNVAYKIGSGSFTTGSLNAGALTFNLPTGTTNFAFAYVCNQSLLGSQYNTEDVIYANVNDGTTYSGSCVVNGQLQLGTLTGSVDTSAIANSNSLEFHGFNTTSDFDYFANVPVMQEQAFNIQVIEGNNDLLITPLDSLGSILAAKELTNQTVPGTLNGGSTVAFSASDEISAASIAYQNLPSGSTPSSALIFNSNSGAQYFLGQVETGYPVMPASLMTGNADYQFTSFAVAPHASLVIYRTFPNTGGNVTINYPNPWTCTAPNPAAFPVFDLSTYTGFTGNSSKLFSVDFSWVHQLNTHNAIYLVAYPDAVNAANVTIPNLAAISNAYPVPASGDTINWSDEIAQYSTGIIKSTPPNSSISAVSCGGQIIVP